MLQLYPTQVIGLSGAELGAALGLAGLGAAVGLAGSALAVRWGKRRLMQAGYAGMLSGLAGLDLLPRLFPPGSLGAFLGMAAMVFLAECSVAGSWPVAWHAWMPEITAPTERGAFLGWMRLASQLFNAAMLAIGSSSHRDCTTVAWTFSPACEPATPRAPRSVGGLT